MCAINIAIIYYNTFIIVFVLTESTFALIVLCYFYTQYSIYVFTNCWCYVIGYKRFTYIFDIFLAKFFVINAR